jgi:predicted ribosomally synthesized peptide with nif11-like leader
MSVQSAHDFIKKAAKDHDLLSKVRSRPDSLTSIAKEYGHDFNKDDFDSAMRERKTASPEEPQPDFCWG